MPIGLGSQGGSSPLILTGVPTNSSETQVAVGLPQWLSHEEMPAV